MDLLAEAIARQDAAAAAEPIDATALLLEQRSHAFAFEAARPRGEAILAWCDAHPEAVGVNGDLVEELRDSLANKRLIGRLLLSIWGEIPETCDVEPVEVKAVRRKAKG
jgi:hypothetical protein